MSAMRTWTVLGLAWLTGCAGSRNVDDQVGSHDVASPDVELGGIEQSVDQGDVDRGSADKRSDDRSGVDRRSADGKSAACWICVSNEGSGDVTLIDADTR